MTGIGSSGDSSHQRGDQQKAKRSNKERQSPIKPAHNGTSGSGNGTSASPERPEVKKQRSETEFDYKAFIESLGGTVGADTQQTASEEQISSDNYNKLIGRLETQDTASSLPVKDDDKSNAVIGKKLPPIKISSDKQFGGKTISPKQYSEQELDEKLSNELVGQAIKNTPKLDNMWKSLDQRGKEDFFDILRSMRIIMAKGISGNNEQNITHIENINKTLAESHDILAKMLDKPSQRKRKYFILEKFYNTEIGMTIRDTPTASKIFQKFSEKRMQYCINNIEDKISDKEKRGMGSHLSLQEIKTIVEDAKKHNFS